MSNPERPECVRRGVRTRFLHSVWKKFVLTLLLTLLVDESYSTYQDLPGPTRAYREATGTGETTGLMDWWIGGLVDWRPGRRGRGGLIWFNLV